MAHPVSYLSQFMALPPGLLREPVWGGSRRFSCMQPGDVVRLGVQGVADASHRPHRLHTTLSPMQEQIVVALRADGSVQTTISFNMSLVGRQGE